MVCEAESLLLSIRHGCKGVVFECGLCVGAKCVVNVGACHGVIKVGACRGVVTSSPGIVVVVV